ncbi:MAG: monoheme cytochrome C [Bacteroidota bacterium]
MSKETESEKDWTGSDGRLLQLANMAFFTIVVLVILGGFLLYVVGHPDQFAAKAPVEERQLGSTDVQIENGIDVLSGFVAEGDYQMVKTTCTGCHSGKLVLQNRATRDGWQEMIHWMQESQGLWDLGENEDRILDYLSTYYAPEKSGRRKALSVEEWYEIP